MPSEKAKNIFLGRGGEKKQNCAQSVLSSFKDTMGIHESLIGLSASWGGGNAPGNVCGAYLAGKTLIEKYCCPEKAEEFENYFKGLAGSLSCKEIRAKRKLSCLGCVLETAKFIQQSSA